MAKIMRIKSITHDLENRTSQISFLSTQIKHYTRKLPLTETFSKGDIESMRTKLQSNVAEAKQHMANILPAYTNFRNYFPTAPVISLTNYYTALDTAMNSFNFGVDEIASVSGTIVKMCNVDKAIGYNYDTLIKNMSNNAKTKFSEWTTGKAWKYGDKQNYDIAVSYGGSHSFSGTESDDGDDISFSTAIGNTFVFSEETPTFTARVKREGYSGANWTWYSWVIDNLQPIHDLKNWSGRMVISLHGEAIGTVIPNYDRNFIFGTTTNNYGVTAVSGYKQIYDKGFWVSCSMSKRGWAFELSPIWRFRDYTTATDYLNGGLL